MTSTPRSTMEVEEEVGSINSCALHFFDEYNGYDPLDDSDSEDYPWRNCHCDAYTFELYMPVCSHHAEGPFALFMHQVAYEAVDLCDFEHRLGGGETLAGLGRRYAHIARVSIKAYWEANGCWLEEWRAVPENMMGREQFYEEIERAMFDIYDDGGEGEFFYGETDEDMEEEISEELASSMIDDTVKKEDGRDSANAIAAQQHPGSASLFGPSVRDFRRRNAVGNADMSRDIVKREVDMS